MSASGSHSKLLRVLGLIFGVAVVVGGMVGQGILRTPGIVKVRSIRPNQSYYCGLLGLASLRSAPLPTSNSGRRYLAQADHMSLSVTPLDPLPGSLRAGGNGSSSSHKRHFSQSLSPNSSTELVSGQGWAPRLSR